MTMTNERDAVLTVRMLTTASASAAAVDMTGAAAVLEGLADDIGEVCWCGPPGSPPPSLAELSDRDLEGLTQLLWLTAQSLSAVALPRVVVWMLQQVSAAVDERQRRRDLFEMLAEEMGW